MVLSDRDHFSHITHLDTRPRTNNYMGRAPWDSPKKDTDDPNWPMTADVIEKGTARPNITSAPHGPTGPVRSQEGHLPEPEEINSGGVNVGHLNGSVQWVPQNRMVEHDATIPHGAIRGYW